MDPRKPQTSTENGGIGQSGYAAGRTNPDPALEKETQVKNARRPHGKDEPQADEQVGADDRWTGRSNALEHTDEKVTP